MKVGLFTDDSFEFNIWMAISAYGYTDDDTLLVRSTCIHLKIANMALKREHSGQETVSINFIQDYSNVTVHEISAMVWYEASSNT